MNGVNSTRTTKSDRTALQIDWDDRTGAPEGMPPEFAGLIFAFADRVYGTWWYIRADGTPSAPQGWYIWIESEGIIGVTRGTRLLWRHATRLKAVLTAAAHELR